MISPLAQCSIFTVLEYSPICFTRQKLRETTEEGVSKRQMWPNMIDASRMEENGPMLPTRSSWGLHITAC